jgi:hypothetical protein
VQLHSSKISQPTFVHPQRPPKDTNGWCSVRAPGVDQNKEPTATSGWGFCWKDDSQKYCNDYIPDKVNSTAVKATRLRETYCVDKLEANLRVEQPGVHR